jgi:hypothetical protein
MRNQSTATDRRKFVVNGGFLTSSFDCGHSAYGPKGAGQQSASFRSLKLAIRLPQSGHCQPTH